MGEEGDEAEHTKEGASGRTAQARWSIVVE